MSNETKDPPNSLIIPRSCRFTRPFPAPFPRSLGGVPRVPLTPLPSVTSETSGRDECKEDRPTSGVKWPGRGWREGRVKGHVTGHHPRPSLTHSSFLLSGPLHYALRARLRRVKGTRGDEEKGSVTSLTAIKERPKGSGKGREGSDRGPRGSSGFRSHRVPPSSFVTAGAPPSGPSLVTRLGSSGP